MAVFYTVSKINEYIASLFEDDHILKNISLTGEISQITERSENFYLSIKDDKSSINAVAFGKYDKVLLEMMRQIEIGMQVEVTGSIKVYKERGTYQLYIKTINEVGIGDNFKNFAQTFAKLKEKGYFDASYKKPLPKYIKRLGVVTAKSGAAIEDIKKIAFEKNEHIEIVLAESLVQGSDAAPSIVRAIKLIDKACCDIVIVGRGGGSKEDLSVFNDEEVAMAIWNMETPVISAVGHEIDTSITDFIADASAPTPTAAADLAVFSYDEFLSDIESYKDRMNEIITQKLKDINNRIDLNKLKLEKLSPKNKIENFKKNLLHSKQILRQRMISILERDKGRLKILSSKIDGLSPLKRIYEGYSYITNEKGKNIKSIKDVKKGENIKARVTDGYIESTVISSQKIK